MLLARKLANFTRGESDALRKAMGKKKKDIVDQMKPKFIEGGKRNGHDPEKLEKALNTSLLLEGLGEVRPVCFQQVACGLLLVGFLSDRLHESPLSCRVHGCFADARQR